MNQNITTLNDEDLADLEAKRDWVRNHYEPHVVDKYDELEGKLWIIGAILANGWIKPEETIKLWCLGITFGDALAEHMGLSWVVVEDAYGRDPALTLPGTTVLIFPQTMISKRVTDGETVDVYDLFNSVSAAIKTTAGDSA